MAHTSSNAALIARVRRISGQVAAVDRALEGEADCVTVLQQVAAIRGAVNGLLDELIEAHLREHVCAPELDAAARQRGADEVMAAIRRYAK